MKTIKLNQIDKSDVQVKEITEKKNGFSNAYVHYQNSKMLLMTPPLYTHYGPTQFRGQGDYTLELSFVGENMDKINKFKTNIENLDNHILSVTDKNDEYQKVRVLKDRGIHPQAMAFKLKCKYHSDNLITDFFDKEGSPVDVTPYNLKEFIRPESVVRVIFQVKQVWLFNNKIGVTYEPKQIIILGDYKLKQFNKLLIDYSSDEDDSDNE